MFICMFQKDSISAKTICISIILLLSLEMLTNKDPNSHKDINKDNDL